MVRSNINAKRQHYAADSTKRVISKIYMTRQDMVFFAIAFLGVGAGLGAVVCLWVNGSH
jgi:hypothetical protein